MQIDEHAAVANRPDATRYTYPVSSLGAGFQTGIMPIEFGRLMRACEVVGIGVDAPSPEAFELADADGAQRIFWFAHFDLPRDRTGPAGHPAAAGKETGRRPRSTTV